MAILPDALRQAFMSSHQYAALRDEQRVWLRIQRPLLLSAAALVALAVVAAVSASVAIVFPGETRRRPLCSGGRIQALHVRDSRWEGDRYRYKGAFFLTDEEAADYYWMVMLVPSVVVFLASSLYLFAGMAVAYSAPRRHICLKVVENNFCTSKRGGVRCLSIINIVFAVVFGLLAIFLGSSLLTLGSGCSLPLFWCYEVASWGLALLYGGTAFFLRRKAAVVLDEGNYNGHNLGLEMLESNLEVTPEMERRVDEGFKAWMGSPLLSSDEEDESNEISEEGLSDVPHSLEQRG